MDGMGAPDLTVTMLLLTSHMGTNSLEKQAMEPNVNEDASSMI